MSDTILYDVQGHIATITLNRPEKHNALNNEAYKTAAQFFKTANADSNVRCIILTWNGRSFCAGDDVEEIMSKGGGLDTAISKLDKDKVYSSAPPLVREMLASRCPIISAVNGSAVGIGMELCLICDIRIASEQARFSEMFVKRGVISTHVSFNLLPEIVGPSHAAQMLLTGELVDAKRALELGLVSQVVSADKLLETAYELANKIVSNPPLSVAMIKQALRYKRDNQSEEIDRFVSEGLKTLVKSRDHKESVKAFLEKREAVYKGE